MLDKYKPYALLHVYSTNKKKKCKKKKTRNRFKSKEKRFFKILKEFVAKLLKKVFFKIYFLKEREV